MRTKFGGRLDGKVKKKGVKANVTSKFGSKRKLSRMGKKMKKGQIGPSTEFITRSAAIRKLQITLKDFRRLCILKGIYPRVPVKAPKGSDKVYYDIKDISYIMHEPLLNKFREFKAFMKKIRRAAGRNQYGEARRKDDLKPKLSLDHLVKERYPRFIDALRDLDDALCMVFLFASLPSEGRIIAEKTTACAELARHWQFYVSKTRTLKKVFVSIKGAYYQAEVMGEPITWLVPHQFTQSIPREVDVRVMLTFLEFYEVFLRFVLFKLFHLQGMVYPPRVDKKMDEAGSCLLALRVGEMNGKANTDIKDSSSTLESTAAVNASTSTKFSESVQMKESKQRISSLPDVLENMEDDNDDLELGLLAKPLGDALKGLQSLDGEDIDGVNEDEKIKFSIQNPQSGLFSKLVVFINREVPLEWLQFSVLSFGGRVGWAGEGSPIDVSDPRVTHQIVDRPMKNSVVNNRELVQPQWIFDCINAKLLLPVHNYRPGATLPPHLSPFVDDDSEGYLPQYREELLKLTGEIPATSGVGKDHSGIDEDSAEDETSDYTKRKMTKAPSTDDATLKKKHSKVSGGATQKGPKGIVAINSESEKTEAEENQELSKIMMSKKSKRLYGRMQHGIQQKQEAVSQLQHKRKMIEEARGVIDHKNTKTTKKKKM